VVSPCCFPPCVQSRADPSGLGHEATIYSSVQGPPGVETPTYGAPDRPLGSPDRPLGSPDRPVPLSGAPSHLSVRVGDYWRTDLFHTGQSGLHTGQSGGLPSGCHLELAVRAVVPVALDSSACRTGQYAGGNTSSFFLDFSLIFLMSSFEVLLSSIPWSK
jgi:hypothetical protein